MFILTTKQHVLTCGDNGSVAFGKNMRAAEWFETLESVAEAQRTIDEWHAPYMESKDTTVFEIVLHDDGISGRYHVVTCDGLLGNGEQDSFCPECAQVLIASSKPNKKVMRFTKRRAISCVDNGAQENNTDFARKRRCGLPFCGGCDVLRNH